jgi:hypothetical protein
MRLVRAEFHGYKRLIGTDCYLDQRIIALVGPNESGKSSVLEGLLLFESDEAVPATQLSRSRPRMSERDPVVSIDFHLQEEDVAVLDDIPLAEKPRELRHTRQVGGTTTWRLRPHPAFDDAIRESAERLLTLLESTFNSRYPSPDGDTEDEEDQYSGARAAINAAILAAASDEDPTKAEVEWDQVGSAIELVQAAGWEQAEAVREAVAAFRSTHVKGDVWGRTTSALTPRVPTFLFFDDDERSLASEYNILDQHNASIEPPALVNLLNVAQVTQADLVAVLEDRTRRQTLLAQCNRHLEDFFAQAWNQSDLTVRLDLEGQTLGIYIEDRDGGGTVVAFHERSDGLRLFVALAAFLYSGDRETPPILLIDEAETHLHYNAQADLINVLTTQSNVAQVIYTTHSPGCLPRDLGTCVRYVRPIEGAERSEIRHDFWNAPGAATKLGFSPLLFVMGAGAAAFSALRSAIVAEGPADMLLLPSLVKAVTGEEELPYQVAPGIAVAAAEDLSELGEIAVSTCFLVDGDAGGSMWRDQLTQAGIDPSRILTMPGTWAVEDFLTEESYVRAVSDLAGVAQEDQPEVGSLSHPYKPSLTEWFASKGIKMPGAIAVAEHLLAEWTREQSGPLLSDEAREKVAGLDRDARGLLGL